MNTKRPILVPAAIICLVTLLAAATLAVPKARAVTMETVPIGNPGNANDPTTFGGVYGGVAYNYSIGKYDVTVGQYMAFLNAVAATDTYALYNPAMATDLHIAGISRSGAPGSYSYSVIGSPNHPITYVSWGDAARFSNWLNNGQATGPENASTTEAGAYLLNGAMTAVALNAVTRNAGATWFIPTANEWYKAAYHKNDGPTNHYWSYPTSTSTTPTSAVPGSTPNTANFLDSVTGYAVTGSTTSSSTQNYLTDVGAYAASASTYGTFDQGGDVYQWNETLFGGSFRGDNGGAWFVTSDNLQSAVSGNDDPTEEYWGLGFRVAAVVPEPSTFVLAGLGFFGVIVCRRYRRCILVLAALLDAPRRNISIRLATKSALLILASIGPLAATNSHAQNLLTNGSFESGAFAGDPASGFMSLPVGSTVIDGWGTSQAELVWGTTPNSAAITASEGSRFLDLTGNHDSAPYGIIDQPFAATAGHRYKVSFDMGTQEDDPALRGPIAIAVTLRHFSYVHYTPDLYAFNFSPTGSGTQWATRSFKFTAPDDFMDVSFEGTVSTGGRYIGLDNVSVTPVSILAARTVDIRYASIPHGHGHFVSFGAPALSDTRVVTYGTGPDGQFGIYSFPSGATAPQGMINVSDGSTPIPGGVGNFTALAPVGLQPKPAVSGENISLFGMGSSGQQGIYGFIGGSLARVADLQTAIPGGTGLFTAFYPGGPIAPPAPAISGSNIAFFGMGASGQQGIYAMLDGALTRLADRNTAIPGGVGTFMAFPSQPVINGEKVAFIGSGPNFQQGIYTATRSDPAVPGSPIKVADTNTPIPGSTGDFSGFANIAVPGEPIFPGQPVKIAFVGQGFEGQRGVYVAELSSDPAVPGQPIKVADTNTLIPGGIGAFTDFGAVSISATDVAFLGMGSAGQTGIFDTSGGALTDVADVGDMLDGKLITGLAFGGGGLFGDPIAFQATFADGSQGIYTVGVPEPATCVAMILGAMILLVPARHQRNNVLATL